MFVIGLDVGTSGVKSTVFGANAKVVGHAYCEYDLISGGEGMYELQPQVLFSSCLKVLSQSAKACDPKKIKAICVTSFGESFVCLDKADNVIANTMIYMDNRGIEECDEFMRILSKKEIFDICGQPVDRMFALYKIKWMQKHHQKLMEKTKRICFIADFITYMLGADHVCDYSLAARSAMFDIRKKEWWDAAVQFSNLGYDALPNPVPSGSVVGKISKKIAGELGFGEEVKLIVGGHDQIFAAIGSGARQPGDIANGIGTVDCMISLMEGDVRQDVMLKYSLPMVPYIEQDTYAAYATNISGGCTLKWFRDHLAKDVRDSADAYDMLAKEAPDAPTSLLFVPYLAGGGSPYMDNTTPGTISGLRLAHRRGDLFRAFMEGESYVMKQIIGCLEEAGINIHRIMTVGGGSNSSLWMQIRADVFEREVLLPDIKEAGTLASAMFCYRSLGLYDSIEQAQQHLVGYTQTFSPNKKNSLLYREQYNKFLQVYETMRNLYGNFGGM